MYCSQESSNKKFWDKIDGEWLSKFFPNSPTPSAACAGPTTFHMSPATPFSDTNNSCRYCSLVPPPTRMSHAGVAVADAEGKCAGRGFMYMDTSSPRWVMDSPEPARPPFTLFESCPKPVLIPVQQRTLHGRPGYYHAWAQPESSGITPRAAQRYEALPMADSIDVRNYMESDTLRDRFTVELTPLAPLTVTVMHNTNSSRLPPKARMSVDQGRTS